MDINSKSTIKIGFFLPGPRRESVGGYKIVYQYADYLASQGFDVYILYPLGSIVTHSRFNGLSGYLKKAVFKIQSFYNWYQFKNNLKHVIADDFSFDFLSSFDILICTSIETLMFMDIKSIERAKKIYFIQDYENWKYSDEIVNATYRLPDFKNITISANLKGMILKEKGSVELLIPNGIESNIFNRKVDYSDRKKNSFLFMYHPNPRKGCDILLDAIERIPNKSEYTFECFSVYNKPEWFPDYIKFTNKPSRDELATLYNNNRFFICSSRYEGFGLTPAEAALCGCVILTTDNGGVNQYIIDDFSGLFFEGINSTSFVKLLTFPHDEEKLKVLSNNAMDFISKELDMDKQNMKFKQYLLSTFE